MEKFLKYFVAAAAAVSMLACGGKTKPLKPAAFKFPTVPAAIQPEQQTEWLRDHFWDGYDFADSAYVVAQDTGMMLRMFALYAVELVDPSDPSPMGELMVRAEAGATAFRYFMFMAEAVLHDPNSELRNDELYIPVLERAVASPLLGDDEKLRPRHELHMALQNRIGRPANDFTYTDINGRNSTLYKIRTPWTLLFFSNPGCPLCAEITRALTASATVLQAIADGRLTILSLYPDDELDAWRQHAADIPAAWIYARDTDFKIREELLYDLKAIPALYLLDADKRVVVKDAAHTAVIERIVGDGAPQL